MALNQRLALTTWALLWLWILCDSPAAGLAHQSVSTDPVKLISVPTTRNSDNYSDDELKAGLHCPKELPKLPILPGRGWDNLMNKEMGQLTDNSYRHCKTTDDGRLLIPDGTFVIPIRQSSLALRSQLIDHWANYTDITCETVSVEARGSGSWWSASGSYSSDYQCAKQHQVDDKTITSRVYYRVTMYIIGYEPSVRLDPTFKSLLLAASAELETESVTVTNFTSFTTHNKSDLLMELIVRDYGDRVLSRVDLGAVLYKEDYLKRTWDFNDVSVRQGIQVAASASFFGTFDFGGSYSHSTTTISTESYENSTTASYVKSAGGGQIHPNMSVDSWVESVPSNLVAVDRASDPIHFLLTPQALPELSLPALRRLSSSLKAAVSRYYAHNTRYGCIKMDSSNFDFHANVDDGSCQSPNNNYTLGGVFETCVPLLTRAGDICASASMSGLQMNPKTGDRSCPSGYQSVLLMSKEVSSTRTDCHEDCNWLGFNCDDECNYYESRSRIDSYWCAAIGGHAPSNNTGYMFGGLYSTAGSKAVNPVTNGNSCPPTFTALYLASAGIHICVGEDYELGHNFAIPFGGFFSCQHGNPLYTELKAVSVKVAAAKAKISNRGNAGASGADLGVTALDDYYTHSCPSGFTQHVAEITDGCEIMYCVAAGSLSLHGHLPIKRPPFNDINEMYTETESATLILPADAGNGHKSKSHGSYTGLIVGIVVGVVAGVGLPAAFAVYWRKRGSLRGGYTEIGNNEENVPIAEIMPEAVGAAGRAGEHQSIEVPIGGIN